MPLLTLKQVPAKEYHYLFFRVLKLIKNEIEHFYDFIFINFFVNVFECTIISSHILASYILSVILVDVYCVESSMCDRTQSWPAPCLVQQLTTPPGDSCYSNSQWFPAAPGPRRSRRLSGSPPVLSLPAARTASITRHTMENRRSGSTC